MADDESLEHFHTIPRALNAVPADDGPSYLGSIEHVSALLKEYATEITGRRRGVLLGELTFAKAIESDLVQAEALARIFLGKGNPKLFAVVGSWNTRGEIAVRCAEWMGIDATDHQAIMKIVFGLFANDIHTRLKLYEEDKIDEAECGESILGAIEEYVSNLIGLGPQD